MAGQNWKGWLMGKLAPPATAGKPAQPVKRSFRRHYCDRCGVDQDGNDISVAWYKIITKDHGPLYLCRHHYLKYSDVFVTSGYPVSLEEIDTPV
jgi:hypothetical protein